MNTKTQLIAFLLFAFMIHDWQTPILLGVMLVLLLALVVCRNQHFPRLIWRLKWFYVVMLLIFIFNTPGEHIANWSLGLSPTYEGLQLGLAQVLRVTVMLAALSLLLTKNTRQQLISGMYFLMKPLTYLGLDVQRFAARLWLTLHYVEQQEQEMPTLKQGLAQYLQAGFSFDAHDDVRVTLENPKNTWLDYLVVCMMVALLVVIVGLG